MCVWWEEGEGEGEGWGREDGESFSEDVGCCFGMEEVWVELVSVVWNGRWSVKTCFDPTFLKRQLQNSFGSSFAFQIELIYKYTSFTAWFKRQCKNNRKRG